MFLLKAISFRNCIYIYLYKNFRKFKTKNTTFTLHSLLNGFEWMNSKKELVCYLINSNKRVLYLDKDITWKIDQRIKSIFRFKLKNLERKTMWPILLHYHSSCWRGQLLGHKKVHKNLFVLEQWQLWKV